MEFGDLEGINMSDEEIKIYVALYFDFTNKEEYDNVCSFIKQTGISSEAVKQGLLNYIDKRINDFKEFEKVDMKDFVNALNVIVKQSIEKFKKKNSISVKYYIEK